MVWTERMRLTDAEFKRRYRMPKAAMEMQEITKGHCASSETPVENTSRVEDDQSLTIYISGVLLLSVFLCLVRFCFVRMLLLLSLCPALSLSFGFPCGSIGLFGFPMRPFQRKK